MIQSPLSFEIIDTAGNRPHNRTMAKKTENKVGPIIAARLHELGQSQKWLASQCGVDPVSVFNWIKKGTIARGNVGPCALALGLTVDQLLGNENPAQAATPMAQPSPLSIEWLDAQEKELLTEFRQCTAEGKNMVLVVTRGAPKIPLPQPKRNVA